MIVYHYTISTNKILRCLWQIRELQSPKVPSAGTFSNLSALYALDLTNNQIKKLQPPKVPLANSYYGLTTRSII
jgi:hypothetical protein